MSYQSFSSERPCAAWIFARRYPSGLRGDVVEIGQELRLYHLTGHALVHPPPDPGAVWTEPGGGEGALKAGGAD